MRKLSSYSNKVLGQLSDLALGQLVDQTLEAIAAEGTVTETAKTATKTIATETTTPVSAPVPDSAGAQQTQAQPMKTAISQTVQALSLIHI